MLFGIVKDDTTIAAKKSVELLSDLYRKRVWTDARTVNVIGTACASQVLIVCCAHALYDLCICCSKLGKTLFKPAAAFNRSRA
jgi:hypothetical protein